MAIVLNDSLRFIVDMSTGVGVDIATLTVIIQNRSRIAQEQLGPVNLTGGLPSWLTRVADANGVYYVFNYTADATKDYPSDFVIMRYLANTVSNVALPLIERTVAFAAETLPLVEPGREPMADISQAAAFFSSRLEGQMWNGLSQVQQYQCLVTASDDIDAEVYKGRKRIFPFVVSTDVADPARWAFRSFPRLLSEFAFIGITQPDDLVMPRQVREACCLQAFYLANTVIMEGQDPNERRNLQMQGVTGFNAGRSGETWDLSQMSPSRLCAAAFDKLRPYLLTSAESGYGY